MNQHAILLDYLRRHGRTSCADLERNCDVRSVTTRMTESHMVWRAIWYGEPYGMESHMVWRAIWYGEPYGMESHVISPISPASAWRHRPCH
jgi:hypothetical protein